MWVLDTAHAIVLLKGHDIFERR